MRSVVRMLIVTVSTPSYIQEKCLTGCLVSHLLSLTPKITKISSSLSYLMVCSLGIMHALHIAADKDRNLLNSRT